MTYLAAGGGVAPVMLSSLSGASLGVEVAALGGGTNPTSATWSAANRAFYIPFILPQNATVVKLWVSNGAAVSGNVDMALYDATYARLVSIGSTAQSGTNAIQEFNIADTVVSAGRYYLGLALDNATGTTLVSGSVGASASLKMSGMAQEAAAFPLPATATPAAFSATTTVPLCGLSLRTLVA